jgi:kynurenine formamidase
MPPRFIDVSHVIEPGMVTYPGLPVPEAHVIIDHDTSRARYQNKSEFLIASLHLCGNTGTYVDSPLHRHRGATDLAGLPLERVAHVPVRVFDARSLGAPSATDATTRFSMPRRASIWWLREPRSSASIP